MTTSSQPKTLHFFLAFIIMLNMVGCTAFAPQTAPTTNPESNSSPVEGVVIPMTETCRAAVDGIDQLHEGLEIPEHLSNGDTMRGADDFDPNQYFNLLTHLSLKEGYTLDFIYFIDFLGSLPLVYAREIDSKPFTDYEDLLESYGEEMTNERSYTGLNHAFNYMEQIQVDGTPESYFQYIILDKLGDQFYLNWHALYNDLIVICDSSDLDRINQTMTNDYGSGLPEEISNQAVKIDFTPTILVEEDAVTMRFVGFTKWGGFFEYIYVMHRENPFLIYTISRTPLVAYDCGISF